MKKEYVEYYCDVCKQKHEHHQIKNLRLPVTVSCSQDDGKPQIKKVELMNLDICDDCLIKIAVIKYGYRTVEGITR